MASTINLLRLLADPTRLRLLLLLEEEELSVAELQQILGMGKSRKYFDELAGKFGRSYVPGRSWKALAHTLITLLPPLTVADLGAGEGTLSQLLAKKERRVIAI